MAIAAVPAYVGQDFSRASPGLRFGMYLPLWGVDRRTQAVTWETRDYKYEQRGQDRVERRLAHDNKRDALDQVLNLDEHGETMRALVARQEALAATLAESGSLLTLDAESGAPFTTGLGNEHPLENGFAFLNPYGLPYLPGSGVKGVLRQAAHELAEEEWGDAKGWTRDAITHLFGLEPDAGDKSHQRGALMFWDVLPQIAAGNLAVDVMTPHQSHYYQQRREARSGDSTTPHDSGQPNPINFLTLPPGSSFAFHVQCDVPFLARNAAALAENSRWQVLAAAAFEHAFAWLGFGAKTAVGYGAMTQDDEAGEQRRKKAVARERAAAEAADAARRAALSPEDAAREDALRRVADFRAALAKAKAAGAYKAGQDFDRSRQSFLKVALTWRDPRSRVAAADALAESATKAWGRPSKWAEMQAAIEQLKSQQ